MMQTHGTSLLLFQENSMRHTVTALSNLRQTASGKMVVAKGVTKATTKMDATT